MVYLTCGWCVDAIFDLRMVRIRHADGMSDLRMVRGCYISYADAKDKACGWYIFTYMQPYNLVWTWVDFARFEA
jgi:hypothetical protein